MEIKKIPLSSVYPSPMNPRKSIDEDELKELSDNIETQGLLQPITVRPVTQTGEGEARTKYEIVCGERRYRAYCMLSERWSELDAIAPKGTTFNRFSDIPAIVREMSDDDAFDAMITENLQRKDVDPMEEAFAFGELIKKGKDVAEIAARFGKSIRFVQDRVKLNALIPELKKEVKNGEMPISAAMIICKITPEQQLMYFKQYKDNYQSFTTATASGFVKGLFYNLTDSVWKDDPEYSGGCGTTCAECPFNTANHGCLFFEMKATGGQCTSEEKYAAKTLAFIEEYLKGLGDTIVKVGQPLGRGKVVLAMTEMSYIPDSVKRIREALKQKLQGLGYEIIDPSDYFSGKCYYNYDDERTIAMLESGECYRVLQLCDYNYVHINPQAWYVKKNDTGTNVDGSGVPYNVQLLLARYKQSEHMLPAEILTACVKAISKHNVLSDGPLTETEKKLFALLMLQASCDLRTALGLSPVSEREKDYEYAQEHLVSFDMFVRAWLQDRICPNNYPAIHQAAPMLDEVGALWCSKEYTKAKEKAQAKHDKEVAKLTKQLADLGYSTDGTPLPKEEESQKQDGNDDILQRYNTMKKNHPDAVLLFRVGDFYECFHDDAVRVSDILGLTLTKRAGVNLCGFPHHALDTYLPKLIEKGARVAICEPIDKPKK